MKFGEIAPAESDSHEVVAESWWRKSQQTHRINPTPRDDFVCSFLELPIIES